MVKKHEDIREKKKQTTNYLAIISVIVVLALIVIGATTVFSPNKKVDYSTYRGFSFQQSGDFWMTQVQLNKQVYDVPFYNHPLDVIDIPYNDSITTMFLDKPIRAVTIAVDGEANSVPVLAGINIARITGKLYGVPTKSALFVAEGQVYNQTQFEEQSCVDSNQGNIIFHIDSRADAVEIVRDSEYKYCIHVRGTDDENILASADMLSYKLLEIIPNDSLLQPETNFAN